jgi:ribosome-associated toxin RatA of RatAB toxin-antitoxin module|tara:strand:+ start:750 stop:1166 length:417 start_codon:yes stop_codon:yes gene_type:complete
LTKKIVKEVVVNHSRSEVLDLIFAYENYSLFIPGCISSTKKEISKSKTQGKLVFSFLNKNYIFESLNQEIEDGLKMDQVSGPFKSFRSFWRVTSVNNKTLINFSAEFETNYILEFIATDKRINSIADKVIAAFLARLS